MRWQQWQCWQGEERNVTNIKPKTNTKTKTDTKTKKKTETKTDDWMCLTLLGGGGMPARKLT